MIKLHKNHTFYAEALHHIFCLSYGHQEDFPKL